MIRSAKMSSTCYWKAGLIESSVCSDYDHHVKSWSCSSVLLTVDMQLQIGPGLPTITKGVCLMRDDETCRWNRDHNNESMIGMTSIHRSLSWCRCWKERVPYCALCPAGRASKSSVSVITVIIFSSFFSFQEIQRAKPFWMRSSSEEHWPIQSMSGWRQRLGRPWAKWARDRLNRMNRFDSFRYGPPGNRKIQVIIDLSQITESPKPLRTSDHVLLCLCGRNISWLM